MHLKETYFCNDAVIRVLVVSRPPEPLYEADSRQIDDNGHVVPDVHFVGGVPLGRGVNSGTQVRVEACHVDPFVVQVPGIGKANDK